MLGYSPDIIYSPAQTDALDNISARHPSMRIETLGFNRLSGAIMVRASEEVTIHCPSHGDPVDHYTDEGWFVLTASGRPMLHDAQSYRLRSMPEGSKLSPARAAIVLNTYDDPAGMLDEDGIGR